MMHAPVVSGETRSCSDVGSPGGGDDAGSYLEVGRIARCRWMGLLGNGLGPNLFGYFSWALCLGLQVVVRSRGHRSFLFFNKILDGKKKRTLADARFKLCFHPLPLKILPLDAFSI